MAPSSADRALTHKFMVAVFDGKLKNVKRLVPRLIEKGIDVANVKEDSGRTALHVASLKGSIPICKYLIEDLKVDVNIKDEGAKTPLHFAAMGNHLPTVKYLLEIGADPNDSDCHNFTALHTAAVKGHTEIISLLISKGAIVDAVAINDNGTPLLIASCYGNEEAVKILLEHDANPNKRFNCVTSPLAVAIHAGSYECVRVLLKSGVDINIGPCGATPIELAVFHGEVEITKCLLEAGANPNVVNMYGDSPIETAALHRNLELIDVLLPLTTRNSEVQDWSCLGLIEYIHSDDVNEKKKMKRREYADLAKSKGDEELKNKNYLRAMYWYGEALDVNTIDSIGGHSDALLRSNRSLCLAKMNEGPRALIDAMACLRLRPDWPIAYYRVGEAWFVMKCYDNASTAFRDASKIDPNNKALPDCYWDATRSGIQQMSLEQTLGKRR